MSTGETVRIVTVEVSFKGQVRVAVPARLDPPDAHVLADKLALAELLAVIENPDAPYEKACEEFLEETGCLEADWLAAKGLSVGGVWRVENEYMSEITDAERKELGLPTEEKEAEMEKNKSDSFEFNLQLEHYREVEPGFVKAVCRILGAQMHVDFIRVYDGNSCQTAWVPSLGANMNEERYMALQNYYGGRFETCRLPGFEGEYVCVVYPFSQT